MTLCRDLWAENGRFHLDEDKVRKVVRQAFNKQGSILAGVGPVGALEGMILMLVTTSWYTEKPHLEELLLYVKPEYRRTPGASNAGDLARFAKWCAESSGMPLQIGILSDIRTEGKRRLYEQHFKKPVGYFFYYDPQAKASQEAADAA